MSTPFNPTDPLIIIPATVEGPAGNRDLLLVLDSACDTTLIDPRILRLVGIDPTSGTQTLLTTASGTTTVNIVPVPKLSTLGQHAINLPVVVRALPYHVGADGLLGLDFMRGHVLEIDFRTGQIKLT